jgi:hypothetical protein
MHPFNRQTGTNKKESPLRSKWAKIKQKTANQEALITMDADWEKDFKNFLTWAIQNGYKSDMRLTRKDKNKWFIPSNCYWK